MFVVDDDVRNTFFPASWFEQHGLQAENSATGHEAIARLDEDDEIDAVLLDIMMPTYDAIYGEHFSR